MTECPALAFLIACAIFAADFRPPSRPRRGNTSGVEAGDEQGLRASAALGAEAGVEWRYYGEVKRREPHGRGHIVVLSWSCEKGTRHHHPVAIIGRERQRAVLFELDRIRGPGWGGGR